MNDSTTETKARTRRERVKTAAILFLAVMLVLTFFSNTILNYSLPEVSGQYAGSGSISTAVRGSGTVTTNEPYSVQADSSREIAAVYVKAGDTVEAGQALFSFVDADSEELKAARTALEELEYAYQTKVIQTLPADYAASDLEIANLRADLADAEARAAEAPGWQSAVDAAEAAVDGAQARVDELTDSVTEITRQISDLTALQAADNTALARALDRLSDAEDALAAAQKTYDTAAAAATLTPAEAEKALTAARQEIEELETALTYAQEDLAAQRAQKAAYAAALADRDEAQEALSREERQYGADVPTAVSAAEITAAERTVEQYEQAVRDAQQTCDEVPTVRESDYLVPDQAAYEAAKAASADPSALRQSDYTTLDASAYAAALALAEEAAEDAERTLENARRDLRYAEEDLQTLLDRQANYEPLREQQEALEAAEAALSGLTPVSDETITAAERDIAARETTLEQKRSELLTLTADSVTARSQSDTLAAAAEALAACQEEADAAQEAVDELTDSQTHLLQTSLSSAQSALTAAERTLSDAQKALTRAQEQQEMTPEAAEAAAESARRALASALTALASQQSQDQAQSAVTELGLEKDLREIEAQRAEVERLEAASSGATLCSRYAGTVTSVSAVVGDRISAGAELAAIDVAGKGYTLSVTVTREQSAQVHVGDVAEVASSRWSSPTVTLERIRTDSASKGQNRILEFSVEGDVTDGETLEISVGDRSRSYDLVVPNSAIREDSNGTFVLVAEAKSTPLATRYTARRVDVTVLAKDTANTAIDAGTDYGYEYVITSSSKPLESGSRVRLVDD